ncbi:SDR family oxidoreductase [Paenibacillus radicis (ex Gao et al. 2016)]|uniref:3-beta hydroxysteroid dehydrogenase n=1 Tax=Paenibacillus radicis (ex Gao et al. 2016) TaxID=1737354 RepID=A0A917H7V3_9BACL|nr:SDR family oxidoreductase [Paenibacillus radicis (ex Gao et al. 2016)]GGG69990.1 3-beta hydroxysteroid dehydrogenase [Paenibacillus radicis (ex Gao et al. 2016)]
MRIFVTGATGFIGSAVVSELINAGHEVIGFARSDEAANSLLKVGASVHRGSLDDLASLRRGAEISDGVIHTAFNHDFSNMGAAGLTDRRAVQTFGAALAGSGRPLVIASVIGHLAPDRIGTEEDAPDVNTAGKHRIASEEEALSLASHGVRVSVLRLPPSVHGDGDRGGFVPALINVARRTGTSAYIGEGSNRWSAVHRLDAARLFRLALEAAPAGSKLHAIGEEGVSIREIAAVIGRKLDLPVISKQVESASDHFGWLANFASQNIQASSTLTQELLGWKPEHINLLRDLEGDFYFKN